MFSPVDITRPPRADTFVMQAQRVVANVDHQLGCQEGAIRRVADVGSWNGGKGRVCDGLVSHPQLDFDLHGYVV
ncbi:MAG: hypothetical protein EXR62_12205 [Chloroflexi bacterium]|nr:hypothetical protein [Chloroflexota bacterium]